MRQPSFVYLIVAIALAFLAGCETVGKQPPSLVAGPATSVIPSPSPPPSTAIPTRPQSTAPLHLPTATPTATWTISPTPTSTPTSVDTDTPTPSVAPTPTPTATSTPTPTPTATATPTPLRPGRLWPTPDVAQATDHYWLVRPFGPEHRQWAGPTYPYGSTAGGQLRIHHGIDIQNPEGTPVLAVAPGTVLFAGDDSQVAFGPFLNFYGQLIILRLDMTYRDRPIYVLYGHLSEIHVQEGEHVDAGQPIGAVGMTGIAMGPHLHLEVRLGENSYGSTRNPELWLEMLPGCGTLVGRLLNAEGRTLPEAPVHIYPEGSDRPRWTITVYADELGINPDDEWGENIMLADMPAGSYRLVARIDGQIINNHVVIEEGKTTFVDLSIR